MGVRKTAKIRLVYAAERVSVLLKSEEAIAEALTVIHYYEGCSYQKNLGIVYIGICDFFKPSLLGIRWDIIDAIQCKADAEGFGDYAEEYLDVPKEWREELEAGIETVFREWGRENRRIVLEEASEF